MTAPKLMKGGIAAYVESTLRTPSIFIPIELDTASLQERACWIMGFEHAMQMVDDYIKAAEASRGR